MAQLATNFVDIGVAVEFSEAFKFSSRGTQGEIPRRYVACVEVLMRPEFGRHNDGDEDPRIHKEFEEGLAKVGVGCSGADGE